MAIITMSSIAAKQFLAEVMKFEETYKKSISELLKTSPENEIFATEFFSNPIIHRYLARRSDSIRFSRYKPIDDYLTSVELSIYKCRKDIFSYRPEADNSNFYLGLAKSIITRKCLFFSPLQNQYNNSILEITSKMHTDETRRYLNKHSNTIKHLEPTEDSRKKIKFILTPNIHNRHLTIMVHIIEPENGKILASVYINSSQDSQYSLEISSLLNNKDSCESIFIDTKEIHPDIKERKIPFIDASHDLQITEDDANCGLYGYNFLEAIAKMLNNAQISEEVFNLAKSSNAEIGLKRIFQEKLKSYLPCYYIKDGKSKSASDRKKLHLAQRWDLSSDILSTVYPPTEEIKFKYKRLSTFESILDSNGKTSSVKYTGKNKVIQYVFDHALSKIQNEKIRLLEKYTPAAGEKSSANDRVSISECLLDSLYEELADFETNAQPNVNDLKQKLKTIITNELQLTTLDKYQNWGTKLALALLNALLFLPLIAVPIKKLVTGSWFFSLKGKTKEANENALGDINKLPTVVITT